MRECVGLCVCIDAYICVLQQAEIEQIEKSERVGGAQQHKRMTTSLNRQIKDAKAKLTEVVSKRHGY